MAATSARLLSMLSLLQARRDWPAAVLAQVRTEARLTGRRGENLLAMVGVPIVVLLFFGTVVSGRTAVGPLLPGTLARRGPGPGPHRSSAHGAAW